MDLGLKYMYVWIYVCIYGWIVIFITTQHSTFSPCSPPRFLGHPSAQILYAYNPSRESEVVVNSVFTAARHFHVPPVHCRVSVDVLLETMLGQAARFFCFLWHEVFSFCSLSPLFCYPNSFLLCVCFSILFLSCSYS